MLIRWFYTLGCAVIFCLSLQLMLQSSRELETEQDYLQTLQERRQDLENWQREHVQLQERLEDWNNFWNRVEQAGLKPDLWSDYPVNIADRFDPGGAADIVMLLSNDVNTGEDFWFTPQYLYLRPFIQERSDEESRARLELQVQGRLMTTER